MLKHGHIVTVSHFSFGLLIFACVLPISTSVDVASWLTAGAALLLHSTPEVSTHGLLFFSLLVSHFRSCDLLICGCVLVISASVDLASWLTADEAIMFLGIPR